MYNVDQWKIVKMLAAALPKRETMRVGEIKDKGFKSAPNDRVVRNALRKPVKGGHIEIAERGGYRLTQGGVAFFRKMEKEGYKPSPVREMTKSGKSGVKKAAKKVAKPAKKAAKPVKKAAKAKKTTKPQVKKNEAKLRVTPNHVETHGLKGGNGAKAQDVKKRSAKIPRPKKAPQEPAEAKKDDATPAQLTF